MCGLIAARNISRPTTDRVELAITISRCSPTRVSELTPFLPRCNAAIAMSKSERKSNDVQHGPIHYPLWFGGSASCFAACVTHPLDLSMFSFSISCKGSLLIDSPCSQGTSSPRSTRHPISQLVLIRIMTGQVTNTAP